jgi:glucuronoarabinoxylan endo-1,4-beta-xylanase
LGLDILRLRNTYQTDDGYIDRSATITAAAASSLGHPIKVLLSSWSPPATLKSNGNTVGGTLGRDEFGNYMYNDFAQWWADSINEYFNHGIDVNYVSMQNEPDWQASWDTCRFDPTETADLAGYKEAFEVFYNMLNTMPNRPKILAPEAAGMSGSRNYIDVLTETDKSNIYGWAHHLYNWSDGGDAYHPDGYIPVMSSFAADYNDKPRMMTEYSKGDTNSLTYTDAMNLAILMHNTLVYDEASAYLYWELTYGTPKGLVSITTTSYTINPVYYAFKHYSAFTDPNWQRIETSSTDSNALRISAYISPDNNQMSIVIINTSDNYTVYDLSVGGYNITDGLIYRTCQTENCVLAGRFKNGMSLSLPGKSIVTVALTGELIPPSNCQEVQDFGLGLPADLTGDCYVDLLDLQLMTEYWLATTPIDISPPGHSPDIHPDSDNIVNLLDFTDLTAQWLICNDPNVPGCISNW